MKRRFLRAHSLDEKSSYGKDLYGIVMKALEGLYRTKLQSTEAWLNVLRGMSLKLPKAFEAFKRLKGTFMRLVLL